MDLKLMLIDGAVVVLAFLAPQHSLMSLTNTNSEDSVCWDEFHQ